MIGIIGAMDEEIELIKESIKELTIIKKYNNEFYKGKINDKDIILVKCGIGMVNATIISTILITEFLVNKIYFSGVAGSLSEKLKVLDVVIGTSHEEYLFDATEFGYKKGIIPRMENSLFESKNLLNEASEKLINENVFYGKIISGDKFVSNKEEKILLGKEFNALAVDMESSAIAHTSYLLGVDFLIIRSISDSLTDNSTLEFENFVKLASRNSKNILLKLI